MKDRRQFERRNLRGSRCTFEHQGQTHEAVMTDFSEAGAGLVVYGAGPGRALKVGETIELCIVTGQGEIRREGKIIWVDAVTRGRRFGVRFV